MNCRVHKISSVKQCTSNHEFEDPISLDLLLPDGMEDVPQNLRNVIGLTCNADGRELNTTCYSKASIEAHVEGKKDDDEISWPLNRVEITEENAVELLELFGVVLPSVLNFARTAQALSPSTPSFWDSMLPENVLFMTNLLALNPFGTMDDDLARMAEHGSASTLHLVLSNRQVIRSRRIDMMTLLKHAVENENVETVNYLLTKPELSDFLRNSNGRDLWRISLEEASIPILNAIFAYVTTPAARKEISTEILFKTIDNRYNSETKMTQAFQDWILLNGEQNVPDLIQESAERQREKLFHFLIDHLPHKLTPAQAEMILFFLLTIQDEYQSPMIEHIITKYRTTINLNSRNFLAMAITGSPVNLPFVPRFIEMGANVHLNHDIALRAAMTIFFNNRVAAKEIAQLLLRNGAVLDPQFDDDNDTQDNDFGQLNISANKVFQEANAEQLFELFENYENSIAQWAKLNHPVLYQMISKRPRETSSLPQSTRKTKTHRV